MKKSLMIFFVLIIAALSVLSVSAAYYDQDGNKYWCNTDRYGCWIEGENGEHEYIMFWSETARAFIMGPDSNAPIADSYNRSVLPLKDPAAVSIVTGKSGNTDTTTTDTDDTETKKDPTVDPKPETTTTPKP